MYEILSAYEDTMVFQAWRKTMSKKQFEEMGNRFEDIEKRQFKGAGFDMAVDQVARIEQRLGLHDLTRFTAPEPACARLLLASGQALSAHQGAAVGRHRRRRLGERQALAVARRTGRLPAACVGAGLDVAVARHPR